MFSLCAIGEQFSDVSGGSELYYESQFCGRKDQEGEKQ